MTSTNGSGGGRHRKPDTDQPTERFPALTEALEKALAETAPIWPTADLDQH